MSIIKSLTVIFLNLIFSLTANAETSWSSGAYNDNQRIEKSLSLQGSSSLQVKVFGVTEPRYDFIRIYDSRKVLVKTLDGNINETFVISGDTISLVFTSDYSEVRSGVTVSIQSNAETGGNSSSRVAPSDIPYIMKYKLNWPLASDLMSYWFGGSGKNKILEFDEILKLSEEAQGIVYQLPTSVRNMFDDADGNSPRQLLLSELRETKDAGGLSILVRGGDFNHIDNEMSAAGDSYQTLDEEKAAKKMHWFREYTINKQGWFVSMNEFTGAFNESTLRLLSKGKVTVDSSNWATVEVSGVSAYFKDSYDFSEGTQPLGYWSFYNPPYTSKYPSVLSDWTYIGNSSFREYNENKVRSGGAPGKDFRIFSTFRSVTPTGWAIAFRYKLRNDEINLREKWLNGGASNSSVAGNPFIEEFYEKNKGFFGQKMSGNYICYGAYTCQNFINGTIIAVDNATKQVFYFNNGRWH